MRGGITTGARWGAAAPPLLLPLPVLMLVSPPVRERGERNRPSSEVGGVGETSLPSLMRENVPALRRLPGVPETPALRILSVDGHRPG